MANPPLPFNPGDQPLHYDSGSSYVASGVIKANIGRLNGFHGYNSGGAQWIMIYNSATVPANGASPLIMLHVGATSSFAWDPGTGATGGKYFTAGISWSNSSTAPTKTVGAADCWLSASYD